MRLIKGCTQGIMIEICPIHVNADKSNVSQFRERIRLHGRVTHQSSEWDPIDRLGAWNESVCVAKKLIASHEH